MRSASLAAMTLMLSAQGMNLGSCPMIGFDATRVTEEFELLETELPLMIIVLAILNRKTRHKRFADRWMKCFHWYSFQLLNYPLPNPPSSLL